MDLERQEAQLKAQLAERRSFEGQLASLKENEKEISAALAMLEQGQEPLVKQRDESKRQLQAMQAQHEQAESAAQHSVRCLPSFGPCFVHCTAPASC